MPIYTHRDETPSDASKSFARLVSTLTADGVEFRTLGGLRLLVDDETHAALTGEGAPAARKPRKAKSAAKPKPKVEKPETAAEDVAAEPVGVAVELPGFEADSEAGE